MGWLDKLIGGRNRDGQPSETAGADPAGPETTESIADHGRRILLSEDAQNETINPDHREPILAGSSGDTIPGGTGEFGRSPTNPVPVNGFWGEKIYLSLLRLPSGEQVLSHRLGSDEGVDVFEVMSADRRHRELLYLDLYHPRRSRRAPDGYTLVEPSWPMLFSSTTSRLERFPADLPADIRDWTQDKLGVPLRAPEVVDAVTQFVELNAAGDGVGWDSVHGLVRRVAARLRQLMDDELGLPRRHAVEVDALAVAAFQWAFVMMFREPDDERGRTTPWPFTDAFVAMLADDHFGGERTPADELLSARLVEYMLMVEISREKGEPPAKPLGFAVMACIKHIREHDTYEDILGGLDDAQEKVGAATRDVALELKAAFGG